MRVSNELLKCVVFLGRVISKGSQEERRLTGTGFVVQMPLPLPDSRLANFRYLITAKHVADKLMAGRWFIRFSRNDDSCEEVELGPDKRWLNHPDPDQADSVDAAIMPLPLPDGAQFGAIPLEMFATNEEIGKYGIGPGNELIIVGLFTKMTGRIKNLPLIRIGNVAMMPTEKVPSVNIGNWRGDSEVFLIECRSLGGLSGSPVFVLPTLAIQSGILVNNKNTSLTGNSERCLFFGLMHGHWLIKEDEANSVGIQSVRNEEGSIATGISIVVPATKIIDLMNHPELQQSRKNYETNYLAVPGSKSET